MDDWAGDATPRPIDDTNDTDDAAATPDPTELRAEIGETRDRLGDTLEQIGDRLNPQHLKAQVTENIREATIGRVEHMAQSAVDRVDDARRTFMDTIRENPVPAAMVGVGLGWLFFNTRRQSADGGMSRRPPYDGGRYAVASSPYGTASRGYGGYSGYGNEDSGLADRVRDTASDVGHRAQNVASTVGREARTQAHNVEDAFHRNPLAVGAAMVAAGLAAGLTLPVTDREVALMGDARDRVVDRVKEVAQETGEKVQAVAGRVLDEAQSTARDAAQEEGLTSGSSGR